MPDYWTIYYYVIAILFGCVIGYTVGLLTIGLKNKKRKSKPNEEFQEDFEHIFNKISALQEKLNIVQSLSSSYDGRNPTQSSLRAINNKLNNILTNYPKEFQREIQSSEVSLTPKVTEELSKESDDSASKPIEHSVKEIPSDFFEEHKIEPQNLSSEITTLYNRGIKERNNRDLFWETFSIIRIGNANAVAQRLGEVFAPDFREAGNGDFLAIESDNQSYFVVPLFDTTITPSAFNEGGIGYAFKCLNYDSQSARSIVKLNQPAIFQRDGDEWSLLDDGKGELIVQN